MQHRIWFDPNDDLLRFNIVGRFSREDAKETLAEVKKLLEGKKRRFFLADISASPNLTIDRDTRKILQQDSPEFEKVALVGATPVTRMISKVIVTVVGRSAVTKFCKTQEEALLWLRGQ
jgi:hypothetical protein